MATEETKPLLLDDKESARNKLGTCAGFCECYKVPHRRGLCTGDNWQPIAATEETKPVERGAFERWLEDQPELKYGFEPPHRTEWGYAYGPTQIAWLAWQASADAALERAAQIADHMCTRPEPDTPGAIADAIRALKGSR